MQVSLEWTETSWELWECGTTLDFLVLRPVLSTYDGDLRDPLWWTQERPVPMRIARRPLGIPPFNAGA